MIDSEDVFDARIAWPGVAASSSANTLCLISIRSGTASTTKSTSPNASYEVVPWMRPSTASICCAACSAVILPFSASLLICPLVTLRASSRPACTSASSMSFSTTGMPAAAIVWAICPPIVPAPTTAALNTNMLGVSSG